MTQLSLQKDWKDVLVLHFGQLGDAVLSLPALDLIRATMPSARLSIGCGLPVSALLEVWGKAQEIVPLDRVRVRDTNRIHALVLMLAYLRRVRGLRPQAVLVLHPNREMNFVSWVTGAKSRLGVVFKRSAFNWLLTHRIEGLWKRQHANTSYYQAGLAFCGLEATDALPPSPCLELGRSARRTDQIVLHTGAGNRKRVLPLDRWVEVARELHACTGRQIAFLSGPEEPGLAEQLAARVDGSVARSGLSMSQLAVELARSSFFIGSDSGPGHLAASLRTPTLTLIAQHMVARYRPLGPRARLLRYDKGIKSVGAERIVKAALDHPQFEVVPVNSGSGRKSAIAS